MFNEIVNEIESQKNIMSPYLKSFSVFLIGIMFLLSGIFKMTDFDFTVTKLMDHINMLIKIPLLFGKILIILAIILEIVAPLVIFYSEVTNKYKKYASISCLSLFVFTILATLIFHFPPKGRHYYPFMSNLSTLGGLLLLSLSY